MESNDRGTGWRARWIAHRNRVLSSPSFQRFAARFPLTRPIARRRARGLFDLVAGFTYSQILAACVETRLLEALQRQPRSAADLAKAMSLPLDGTERLLRGAAALGLAESIGDRWTLGQVGAELLGNRGALAMIAHHRLLYADLADPVGLLRAGKGTLGDFWAYGSGDAAPYSELMAESQALLAEQVIDSYPFARHRRLLDVGGGQGAFVTALAGRVPTIDLALFDLPEVADRARQQLPERIITIGGNFLADPLPSGFDVVTLIRVLHDHDDEPALRLLKAIHAALPEGGTLVIAEPMAETSGAERAGDAYFGFYLLAMGSGQPRSKNRITEMLGEAGFSRVRERRSAIPLISRTLAARK